MTVLVAVKCTDGIIVGADSASTSTNGLMPTIQLESNDKIRIFEQNIIVACTGAIGYSQRLHDHIEMAVRGGVFKQQNRRECFTNISKRFLSDLQSSMAQVNPQTGIGFGAIVALVHSNTPYLVEFGSKDSQYEEKDGKIFFVSMGSGQILADPFLAFVNRVLWQGQIPSLELGRLGVYWTLDHVIRYAVGGVGGKIRIAMLRHKDGQWITSDMSETEEPAQFLGELEGTIGAQASRLVTEAPATAPPRV
jgi:Proteasome subunit